MNLETMRLFLNLSIRRMVDHYLPKLTQALSELDDSHLWRRERAHMNSVGGIVLHVCEHLERNIVRYSSENVEFPHGIEEHFPDAGMPNEQLRQKAEETFQRWRQTMLSRIDEGYGWTEEDMHRVYHVVEHTGYHLGQVIDRVRRYADVNFRFCQNGLNEKNLMEKRS